MTCTAASLANGDSVQFTITVTAPGTAGSISNTATVSSSTADPDTSDNATTLVTTVNAIPSADLSIDKSATPTVALMGAGFTYTITVTNNGPDSASSLTVSDTLPADVTFGSASAGCNEVGGIVTCTSSNLANGDSVAFTINVTAPLQVGVQSNTATVTSSPIDPVSSNNSATLETLISSPVPVPGLTTWAFGALALVMAALVIVARRRRRAGG